MFSNEIPLCVRDMPKTFLWLNGSTDSTAHIFENISTRLKGLFDRCLFKKDTFRINNGIDSIRSPLLVVYAGLCTIDSIVKIIQYDHVKSILIYDLDRQSSDEVLGFRAEKFHGIFFDSDDLTKRICELHYHPKSIPSVNSETIVRLREIQNTISNIERSNTTYGEQPYPPEKLNDQTTDTCLFQIPTSTPCNLKSLGCDEPIISGKEHEHFISREHTSNLKTAMLFLYQTYQSILDNLTLHQGLLDGQTLSAQSTQTKSRTYSTAIENLTRLVHETFFSLDIPPVAPTTMINHLSLVELQIISFDNPSVIGILVWPIFQIIEQLNKLVVNTDDSVESPVFKSSLNGPDMTVKLRVKAKVQESPYISVHFTIQNGEPTDFCGWFEITLLDISGKSTVNHYCKYINASTIPVTHSVGENFIEKHHLEGSSQYKREDITIFVIKIKPNGQLQYPVIPQSIEDFLQKLTKPNLHDNFD